MKPNMYSVIFMLAKRNICTRLLMQHSQPKQSWQTQAGKTGLIFFWKRWSHCHKYRPLHEWHHDAGPEQECIPGWDRQRLWDHRLSSSMFISSEKYINSNPSAGRVCTTDGVSSAGGLCTGCNAFQLHRYWRKSSPPLLLCVVTWWFETGEHTSVFCTDVHAYSERSRFTRWSHQPGMNGPTVGKVCFNHRDFAGVHFTGSTGVFNNMGKRSGKICRCINHIQELWERQAEKILCWRINQLIRMWWQQHCCVALLSSRAKVFYSIPAYIPSNIAEEEKKSSLPV